LGSRAKAGSPDGDGPLISVIITAHDRRKYLMGAVASALNQTLRRDLFEVIVAKNFADPEMDGRLSELGVKNVLTDEEGQGGKIAEALRLADGTVISFLDDDDEFLPDKLEVVHRRFARDGDLVFYKNGIQFVDEEGRPLFSRAWRFHLRGPQGPEALEKVFIVGGSFNTSSITVRRSIIEDKLGYLRRIRSSSDTFMLYSAFLSGRGILAEPHVLTRYRLHGASTMYHVKSFDGYLRNRVMNRYGVLMDHIVMAMMCRGSRFHENALRGLIQAKVSYMIVHGLPGLSRGMPSPGLSLGEILYWMRFSLSRPSRASRLSIALRSAYLLALGWMPGGLRLEVERLRYRRIRAKYWRGELHRD
jgi:glycosyltransferase involved in cell wall biosynthesis